MLYFSGCCNFFSTKLNAHIYISNAYDGGGAIDAGAAIDGDDDDYDSDIDDKDDDYVSDDDDDDSID